MNINKILIFIFTTLTQLLHAERTITILNNSTKYLINTDDIKVYSDTFRNDYCHDISNTVTLFPNDMNPEKSKYEKQYKKGNCINACYEKFSVLNQEYVIEPSKNEVRCGDHVIEIKDDGVYYTGATIPKKENNYQSTMKTKRVMDLPKGLTVAKLPGFNEQAYVKYNTNVKSKTVYTNNPTKHFIDIGSKNNFIIHIDLPQKPNNPVIGKFIGLNKYLKNNYDLIKKLNLEVDDYATKILKIFDDYISSGAQEGRQIVLPLAGFNDKKYLELNKEISNDLYYKNNPMQHFIDSGYKDRNFQIDLRDKNSQAGVFVGIDQYLKLFPDLQKVINTKDPIAIQLIKIFDHYKMIGNKIFKYAIFESKSAQCDIDGGTWKNQTCVCKKGFEWSGTKCVCAKGSTYMFGQCIGDSENKCLYYSNGNPTGRKWDEIKQTCKCKGNLIWNGNNCVCPSGTVEIVEDKCGSLQEQNCLLDNQNNPIWNLSKWDPIKKTCICSNGRLWNGQNCVCPSNLIWNSVLNKCISQFELDCKNNQGVWDGVKCVYPEKEKDCIVGGGTWDGANCNCSGGRQWTNGRCICPYKIKGLNIEEQTWDGSKCVSAKENGCKMSGGIWENESCKCPQGTNWYWSQKLCH